MNPRRWIVTFGGVGFLPAPGTMASAATCLLLWTAAATLDSAGRNLVAAAGLLVFSAASVALGRWAEQDFHDEDPGPFVLDEVAGICLTLLFLPMATIGWEPAGRLLLAVFVTFRIFDISKPPPCRQLERLGGGWGILMDDLAAAVYANIVCQLLARWILAGSTF